MSRKKADKSVYHGFGLRLLTKITDKSAFAKSVGVSYETVRVWCRAESIPDVQQLLSISAVLGVSIDWLLTGKEHSGSGFGWDWNDEVKTACNNLALILKSHSEPTKQAVLAVISQCLEQERRIKDLERQIRGKKKGDSGPRQVSRPSRMILEDEEVNDPNIRGGD